MSVGKNTIAGKKLIEFLERVERLEQQRKSISNDIKVVKAEAVAAGFSPKGIAVSLKARAQKPSQFREEEDVRDVYLHAIGIAATPPLFKHFEAMAGEPLARLELIERMKEIVPLGASIVVEMEGAPMRLWRDDKGTHAEEVKALPPSVGRAPGAAMPERPPAPQAPDCSPAEAEKMGAEAFRADKPITANPFPFGDKRQPRWDAGWRGASGTDGMGED
jgi:uncharacterized protein (UPF0335 family)